MPNRRGTELQIDAMTPVSVPLDFNEYRALGYVTHAPLQQLKRVPWTGVERRVCTHEGQCRSSGDGKQTCNAGEPHQKLGGRDE